LSTLMKTLICTAVIALLLVGFAASASGGDLTGRVTAFSASHIVALRWAQAALKLRG